MFGTTEITLYKPIQALSKTKRCSLNPGHPRLLFGASRRGRGAELPFDGQVHQQCAAEALIVVLQVQDLAEEHETSTGCFGWSMNESLCTLLRLGPPISESTCTRDGPCPVFRRPFLKGLDGPEEGP